MAVRNGAEDIISLLFERGADVNAKSGVWHNLYIYSLCITVVFNYIIH
jgi:ankyrin repeat protein